ncbi:MAG: LVIVD repeat-containing protein, partial [Aurantibacter sp.]
ADYLVATPLLMTTEEFRNSVDILPPEPIKESGKIYAYRDYIFVNDKYRGVHVVDNSDASSPRKITFIKIAGNVDISVKDDFLYADSIMDLMVFDISDINNIRPVKRLENVLQQYVAWPVEADVIDWNNGGIGGEIQVGWETRTERMLISEYEQRFAFPEVDVAFDALNSAGGGETGQGGSLARFKIVGDYLYAVDSHNINIFEISDLANPLDLEDVYAGFDIETIFNQGQYLFLGSMRGMYIYNISSPDKPEFVSEFEHGTACDPVVVDGDYAYVTLRGGNNCGATESGLFIVDISNISNPELKISYPMDGPYGLGIKDEKLFVCDGESGLKVYDKTDVENLVSLNHFENINTFDVIPMDDNLLMVGDQVLYQYKYLENDIELMSTLDLN